MTAPYDPTQRMVDVRDEASVAGQERSVGELFGQLTVDMGTLVRKEIELARLEIKEEVTKAGKAGAMLGAAGMAGHMALLLLSFAIAWGLSEVMPAGLAFLLVAVAYGAGAAVLYSTGRAELQKMHPAPTQTIETLKEDARWASQLRK